MSQGKLCLVEISLDVGWMSGMLLWTPQNHRAESGDNVIPRFRLSNAGLDTPLITLYCILISFQKALEGKVKNRVAS